MDNRVTMIIDIITVIGAFMAAIAAIYTAVVTKNSNEKTNLLNNYTAERLRDINNLKKCAALLLSEALKATYFTEDFTDTKEKISKIIEVSNEYWLILKPVYIRDKDTLKSMVELKNELIDYYMSINEEERKKHIPAIEEKSVRFRQLTFLYIQSSWTCVKHQILYGEKSEYREFNQVYMGLENQFDVLLLNEEFKDLWNNI